jgi:hypothetical protein
VFKYIKAKPKSNKQDEKEPITKYLIPASTLKSEFHPIVAKT